MSLVYEACLEDNAQRRHLEAGPGAYVGALVLGKTSGVGWRMIFARARRWYEAQVAATPSGAPQTRIFLFGFSRGALLARHFAAWLDRLGIEVEYLGLWDTLDARLAWDSTTQSFDNAAANALVKPYIRKGWEF